MEEKRPLFSRPRSTNTLASALCPRPRPPCDAVADESIQAVDEDGGHTDSSRDVVDVDSRAGQQSSSKRLTRQTIIIVLTISTAVFQVGSNTLIAMYTDALQKHIVCGKPRLLTSVYFVLVFTSAFFTITLVAVILVAWVLVKGFRLECDVPQRSRFLCALMNSINSVLFIFAIPPDRTPVFLQALLTTAVIPFTVIVRYILLRKGIDAPRAICALAAMVGLVISLEPVLFKMNGSDGDATTNGRQQWIWCLIFLFAMLPLACMNVLEEGVFKNAEKDSKHKDINSLIFLAWILGWSFVIQAALFFTDLIPWFGQSNSFSDFFKLMTDGLDCMFGSPPSPYSYTNCTADYLNCSTCAVHTFNPDPHCEIPIFRFWLMAIFFCLSTLALLMLVKYSEGAIYAVLVNSLNAPMGSVFWMFFHLDPLSHFSWKPTFDESTVYVFVGLLIIVPAIALYNYNSYLEEKREEKATQREHMSEPATAGRDSGLRD